MSFKLYQQYTRAQATAVFGGTTQDEAVLHDGWAKIGHNLLGFFHVGLRPPDTHFCNSQRFHWYGPEELGVPKVLREFSRLTGGHLFIRRHDEDKYTYVARIKHVGMHGTGPDGCEAAMDIEPPVPSQILHELGGLYLHADGVNAMARAVAMLRGSTDSQERFEAFQEFVSCWRGPVAQQEALPRSEVGDVSVPVPTGLQRLYEWAGNCHDVMNAGYFSIPKPDELKVYDDRFVAVCIECQWCGNYFVRADEAADEDAQVFVDECGEGRSGDGYLPLGIGLSHLLWAYFIAFNTDQSPFCGAVMMSPNECDQLTSALPPLPVLGPTAEQRVRTLFPCFVEEAREQDAFVFAGRGVMGYAYSEGSGHRVHLAARTEGEIPALLSSLDIDPQRLAEPW